MLKLQHLAVLTLLLFAPLVSAKPEIQSETVISQAELDQILAPIALYPDTVLSHILIASTYPLEVVQAERWVQENTDLSPDEALLAAEVKDWDPSVTALVAFPDVLKKMSSELDWTRKLGDAFLQDEAMVLQRIQDLRQYAYKKGNLDSLEHLNVTKEKTTIIIEPAEPEVVYVPYYDTRVVYGDWWWPHHPPVYWAHRPHYRHSHHFYWAPSIRISSNFYFSAFHWHNRHIVVVPRHRYRDHRFRSGRHVVRHRDSRRWEHNPRHRRGIDYRHPRVREHFDRSRHRRHEERYSSRGDRERHATRVSERLRTDSRSTRHTNVSPVGRRAGVHNTERQRNDRRLRDRVQPQSRDRSTAGLGAVNRSRNTETRTTAVRDQDRVSAGRRASNVNRAERAPVIRRERERVQTNTQRRAENTNRRETASVQREQRSVTRSANTSNRSMRSRESRPSNSARTRHSNGGGRRSSAQRSQRER